MRAIGPSFLSQHLRPQELIRRNQTALAEAQEELSTQRWHDVSLRLGHHAGRNLGFHAELSAVETELMSIDFAKTTANGAAVSLEMASKVASDFLKNLVSSRSAESGQSIIRAQAEAAFSMLRDALNAEVAGTFPMAGRNQDSAPVPPYQGSGGQAQVAATFAGTFGFPPGDPAMQTLSPGQFRSFLDGSFAALFTSPNWETTFSQASLETISFRSGTGVQLDLLPNANEQPIRRLYAALAAVMDFSTGDLPEETFKTLVDRAAEAASSAVQGLGDMQARLAVNQSTLAEVAEQLDAKKRTVTEALHSSESVDSYEVATRINGLMAQLEASYSVTSRISRISLLNYL